MLKRPEKFPGSGIECVDFAAGQIIAHQQCFTEGAKVLGR